MNTDLKVIGTLRRDDEGKIIFDEVGELYVRDGMRVYGDDSLAPQQSERDLLRAEFTKALALMWEIYLGDPTDATCSQVEGMLNHDLAPSAEVKS